MTPDPDDFLWPARCRHCSLVTEDPDAFFFPPFEDPEMIPEDRPCPGAPDGMHVPDEPQASAPAQARMTSLDDQPSGAICGGAPYLWATEPEPERWCFGERKRRTGTWELRAGWERGTVPDESVGYWEPVWVYRCDGCGEDARWGFGWEPS